MNIDSIFQENNLSEARILSASDKIEIPEMWSFLLTEEDKPEVVNSDFCDWFNEVMIDWCIVGPPNQCFGVFLILYIDAKKSISAIVKHVVSLV